VSRRFVDAFDRWPKASGSGRVHRLTASNSVINGSKNVEFHRLRVIFGVASANTTNKGHRDTRGSLSASPASTAAMTRANSPPVCYTIQSCMYELVSFAVKSRSSSEAFSSGSGIKCKVILQRNRGNLHLNPGANGVRFAPLFKCKRLPRAGKRRKTRNGRRRVGERPSSGLVKLLGAGPGKEDRRKFLERLQSWPERVRVKALAVAACF
jgi:hypothetical protein